MSGLYIILARLGDLGLTHSVYVNKMWMLFPAKNFVSDDTPMDINPVSSICLAKTNLN